MAAAARQESGRGDLFDLGEFDQKGTVCTKYGTRAQLEAAVRAAHQAGLRVYVDAIFNHKVGADGTATVMATPGLTTTATSRSVRQGHAYALILLRESGYPCIF